MKDDQTRDGSGQRDVQPVQATRFGGHDVGRFHHDDMVVLQTLDQARRYHGDVGHVDERDELLPRRRWR